jgi:tetratricopeptide (TPR) repeat protein
VRPISPFFLIALCAVAAVSSGVVLLQHTGNESAETETASVYILGPARALLSKSLYKRADVYFHKGASGIKEAAFNSIFQKWKKAICPNKHAHTQGNETSEILPWLRLASQTDPQNIEIYLVACFWLVGDCGRPDLALAAISEAQQKNPERYELLLEEARIHLSLSNNMNAIRALETARKLMQHQPNDAEQASIDLDFIHLSLSYLFEADDDLEQSISAMAALAKHKPTHSTLERLENLKAGAGDPLAAQDRLKELFYKEHECERDHEHGPDCGCSTPAEEVHTPAETHVHGPHCDH